MTPYCWWKESCTSWYGKYPIIYRVLYIPGGAGFLPSTIFCKKTTSHHILTTPSSSVALKRKKGTLIPNTGPDFFKTRALWIQNLPGTKLPKCWRVLSHGINVFCIYLPTWIVDLYGKCKMYASIKSLMDPLGICKIYKHMLATNNESQHHDWSTNPP